MLTYLPMEELLKVALPLTNKITFYNNLEVQLLKAQRLLRIQQYQNLAYYLYCNCNRRSWRMCIFLYEGS